MKIVSLILLLVMKTESEKIFRKSAFTNFTPCVKSFFVSLYQYGSYPIGEENQYIVVNNHTHNAGTTIVMEFDSMAFMELTEEAAQFIYISASIRENTFNINYFKEGAMTFFIIKGPVNGTVPYFNSILIDGVESCETPLVGYLDNVIKDIRIARQVMSSIPDHDCGRRKLEVTELIYNGESTISGEWPWHAAIYTYIGASNSYICGGTLISKLFVLTAAHCATIDKVPVVPDILRVVLGKHHLTGGDTSSQEREVYSVIIHEDFGSPQPIDNDIALFKLMTEVVYNSYVQPACLWSSDDRKLPTNDIVGTVVGWGQTIDNEMSSELRQATLPIISKEYCTMRNPTFYAAMLNNGRKFCAGWDNGTLPCIGDSGGGFMVHVPDASASTDAWYIRGIVSNIKTARNNKCDPEQYVIFSDTSKYEIWIRTKTHENIPT